MADFRKFSNEVALPDWLDKVRLLAELDSRLRQGDLTGLDLTETEWGQVQSRKTWQRMLQILAGLGAPLEYKQLPAGVIYRYTGKRWDLGKALCSMTGGLGGLFCEASRVDVSLRM